MFGFKEYPFASAAGSQPQVPKVNFTKPSRSFPWNKHQRQCAFAATSSLKASRNIPRRP
jgi:hypothetical protein